MNIDPKDAVGLPLHDALVLALTFPTLNNGFEILSIKIRLNPEESTEPFRALGLDGSELVINFESCERIIASLIGFCAGYESISSFDLVEKSEIDRKLPHDMIGKKEISHFRIQGSHGSLLDILSSRLSIFVVKP